MHRLAAMNLALAGAQATKEGFQVVVGAIPFGPSVARKEPRPALAEGGADMRDHLGLIGVVLGVLFQFSQEGLDLALDAEPCGAPILGVKGGSGLNPRQELLQERVAPFFWLRRSEASKRPKSSKTRRPPRAKGGLLPSVSVDRINSA